MRTDANDADGEMVKLNVKVPRGLLEEIDEFAEELEYTHRSEFIREVLRDTTEPILTPGAQAGVSEGYADVAAAGRTMSRDARQVSRGLTPRRFTRPPSIKQGGVPALSPFHPSPLPGRLSPGTVLGGPLECPWNGLGIP